MIFAFFQVGLFAGAFLVLFIAVILSAVFHKQRPENTINSPANTNSLADTINA